MTDDLSQLASTGLPTLGGPLDTPFWSRSLPDAKPVGDLLWGGTAQTKSTSASLLGGSTNATPLVGRRLPELGRLSGSLGSVHYQNELRPEQNVLNWKDNIEKHEIDILSNIVKRAETLTNMRSREMIEKQVQNGWEKTKDLYTKELVGTRTLRGSSTITTKDPEIPLMWGNGAAVEQAALRSTPATGPIPRQVAATIRPHLAIVKEMNRNNSRNLSAIFIEITRLMESIGLTSLEVTGYVNALKLAERLVSRPKMSPIEKALGTMNHLSSQFQTWIINRVRQSADSATVSTHSISNSAMGNTIGIFVKSELGGTPCTVWPALYYCLRVGDAVAAKETFESSGAAHLSDGAEASILAVLSHLADRQGSSASFWERAGPFNLPTDHMRSISEACERSKTANLLNIHRVGFLALLSGSNDLPTSDSVSGFRTIEDYLFGSLWRALISPNPEEQLGKVGERIRHFGPSYFGDQESGGWSYAMPLLASQQYRTALSFLADAGGPLGLLQATHWGLLLSLAGDDLNDVGDEATAGNLITPLLTNYAKLLQEDFGAVASLEYICLIPNKALGQKEIVSLILNTSEVDTLAGTLSAEGMRQNGELDHFFSPAEISSLLNEAAETLCSDTKDREKAMLAGILFMLAGNFRSVITLLNRLISPPEIQDENKRFWFGQSEQFHSLYLNKRCHVLDVLQRDNNMDVVATNRSLMDLYRFFECLDRGQFDEALTLVDGQNLLPTSPSDVSMKEMRYRSMDSLLQKTIPDAITGSMQAVYHQYRRVKGLAGGSHRAAQLKSRARALATFAGMLPSVDPRRLESISRLEAQMI